MWADGRKTGNRWQQVETRRKQSQVCEKRGGKGVRYIMEKLADGSEFVATALQLSLQLLHTLCRQRRTVRVVRTQFLESQSMHITCTLFSYTIVHEHALGA